MAPLPAQQTDRLLEVLHEGAVEFAVVGGVAAIAHGSARATQDLDIAAAMTEANLTRLLDCLAPYRPRHATRPDLGVVRTPVSELAKFRFILLLTDLGRLDLVARMEPVGAYHDLETVELELLPGRSFRVISLDQLIEVKSKLGRPRDRIVEHELRAVRERKTRGPG